MVLYECFRWKQDTPRILFSALAGGFGVHPRQQTNVCRSVKKDIVFATPTEFAAQDFGRGHQLFIPK